MSSETKQNKKKLSPKAQQILDIVVTAIEALVVVVCIVVSVTVWVGVSDPTDRTINWFAVQTDSMMGTGDLNFDPGDLVFTKKPKDESEITVGTVIAFHAEVKGADGRVSDQILIHRVVEVVNAATFRTKGDNTTEESVDTYKPTFSNIVGVYHGKKVKGLGKVVLWLGGYKKVDTLTGKAVDPSLLGGYGYEQTGKTTAFLIIIIPLALLFIYNGYVVAKWVMEERAKKIRAAALAEAQAGQAESAENEAAIKRAALVEFMKAQGMTEEQIEAYFAQQAATQEAAEQEALSGETQEDEQAQAQDSQTSDSQGE